MKKHEFCIPETNTIAKPIAEIIGSTDGGTGKYLYEDTGIKCPSSISTTLKADVSADRWSNVANKPILDPFTKPLSSFLQPTTNSSTYYASNYPMPDISIPNNVPNFNFISNSNSFSSDSKKVSARYEALQKGFTGQVLGGASHDGRHKRDYSEKPQVNNEVLSAVREIDRKDNAKAVNFILFHDCQLNDDDMYWLSATFNYHGPRGLAVNTVDLSNNCLKLEQDNGLPFFSFKPYNTPRNILRLDLSNNNIGDYGAKVVADGLANGVFPITKQVNLSGNKITETGEAYLINAVKVSANTDLNVFAVKAGWRNTDPMWKQIAKSTLKGFLQHAKNQGIDTEHVATNKSALDYIFNTGNIIKNMFFGWGKCSNTLLEILSFNTNAPSITKGFALEMYGTKAIKKADFRICMALEAHDAVVSIEGVELAVKAVDLLGDGE